MVWYCIAIPYQGTEKLKTDIKMSEHSTPKVTLDVEEPIEVLNESPKRHVLTKGMQIYLVALFSGSLMKACSKMLVERMDLFMVMFCRMFITGALSLGSMYFKGVDHYFWGPPGSRVLLFIRGSLGTFNITATCFAIKYITLPDHEAISFLTPLVTILLAHFILKEQYRWQQAVASLVSLLGVIVIARPPFLFGEPNFTSPDGTTDDQAKTAYAMHTAAVLSSLCVVFTAAMVAIILRKLKDRVDSLHTVANYAVQAIFFSFIALTIRGTWFFPTKWSDWLLICGLGTFGFLLQYLTSVAMQMEEASAIANLKYTQIVYATVLEAVFWHDLPDWVSGIGIALTLTGVIISTKMKRNTK